MKTQSDSGLRQAPHPQPPRAKAVAKTRIRQMKPRSLKEPRTYEALRLETIDLKKSVTRKPCERRSEQTLSEGMAALNKMMVIHSPHRNFECCPYCVAESGSVSPEPLRRTVSARGNKPPTTFFPIPTLPEPPPPKTSHKKTGRPPARRGRVGRNQYTKDRDLPHRNDAHRKSTPARSNSSQNADGGTPGANGIANGHAESNGLGKPSKPRHMNPNKTTMNDMKRRVANILEFISITQVQMAGATAASTTKSSTSTNTPPDSNSDTRNGDQKGEILEGSVSTALSDLNGIDERAFGALNSLEMMDVLTRQLLKWQGEYGKWDK